MNCSSSAKATISSKRFSISRLDSPSSEAFRKTLSRPVRSGWKPAPSSSRAANLPLTSIRPSVGWMIPATHLRRVDFPEPLWPSRPQVSPSPISASMPRRAQNSSYGTRPKCCTRSLSEEYYSWWSLKRLETPVMVMAAGKSGPHGVEATVDVDDLPGGHREEVRQQGHAGPPHGAARIVDVPVQGRPGRPGILEGREAVDGLGRHGPLGSGRHQVDPHSVRTQVPGQVAGE